MCVYVFQSSSRCAWPSDSRLFLCVYNFCFRGFFSHPPRLALSAGVPLLCVYHAACIYILPSLLIGAHLFRRALSLNRGNSGGAVNVFFFRLPSLFLFRICGDGLDDFLFLVLLSRKKPLKSLSAFFSSPSICRLLMIY